MRGTRFAIVLAAFGGGVLAGAGAQAGSHDPLVISGVGPETAVGEPAPAPAPRPTRVSSAGGGLGGGFLEMLVTGRDPTQAVVATQPTREPVESQERMSAPVERAYTSPSPRARVQQASAPAMGVRRAIDPEYQRQEVDYATAQPAGSLVVDTPSRHLYLVLGNGRALRYGIGVGRPGFEWAGIKTVSRKAEWPGWTPPPEMLLRRPDLPRHMDGGPENPLGARALYLGSSMYRIHGTNEPWTIGQNVSSGCIRMMNEDVIDLYERVKVGTKVQVI